VYVYVCVCVYEFVCFVDFDEFQSAATMIHFYAPLKNVHSYVMYILHTYIYM